MLLVSCWQFSSSNSDQVDSTATEFSKDQPTDGSHSGRDPASETDSTQVSGVAEAELDAAEDGMTEEEKAIAKNIQKRQ